MTPLSSFNIHMSARSRKILGDLAPLLARLYRLKPRLVERALLEFARAYWPSLGCCVFRGFKYAPQVRLYLKLLVGLGIPELQIRIICFASEGSWIVARWEKLLQSSEFIIVFRHPPNGKAAIARTWIAIEPVFPQDSKLGRLTFKAAGGFSVLMRFAAGVVLLIKRKAAASEPGETPLNDASAEGENPCRE